VPRSLRTNPLALAVLVSLVERPMHPYEVAQTLRSRAKHDSVRLNYGSLYAVVEGLEKRGLITARETVREGRRPERTIYEITEAGHREATEWLAELVSVPAKEFPQFMAGLSFLAALSPDEAVEALRQRATALQLRLVQGHSVEQAAASAGLPRLFQLEGEYEHALLAAEQRFVHALIDDIEGGTLDGLDAWRAYYAGGDPFAVHVDLEGPLALGGGEAAADHDR
jgi:DNA-binding PadR family transcriptional regulator